MVPEPRPGRRRVSVASDRPIGGGADALPLDFLREPHRLSSGPGIAGTTALAVEVFLEGFEDAVPLHLRNRVGTDRDMCRPGLNGQLRQELDQLRSTG